MWRNVGRETMVGPKPLNIGSFVNNLLLIMGSCSSAHLMMPQNTLKTRRANKTCHPNPTALEGNLLTDRGNVVELVKAR